MPRYVSEIFVFRHLAILESSPCAANYLFVLFRSVLLRGMNSYIVSFTLRRVPRNVKNCFMDSSMGKMLGNTSVV